MGLSAVRINAFESLIRMLDGASSRRPSDRATHLETGAEGELAAFFYLRRLGYTVVARGWRSAKAPGDLDLIAWDGDTVCFVEVKTRSTRDVATAEAAVNDHKRKTLRRLASHYLRQLPDGTTARFDVLSIYVTSDASRRIPQNTEFALFKAAFDWT